MKYAIVENEVHAMNHLKELIANLRPDWELTFSADSVSQTVKCLAAYGEPDLLFLDIELNDGNVFRLFSEREVKVPVIFTTAYDAYCLQAFKVNSIDYVMKPLSMEELLFAIRKYENSPGSALSNSVLNKLGTLAGQHKPARILISNRDSYTYIGADEVAWFESEDKCQFLVTMSGARHITTFATLNDVEEILPADRFFRVTRSCLINIAAIKDVRKSFNYKLTVLLQGGGRTEKVNISVAKKKEFLNWFGRG